MGSLFADDDEGVFGSPLVVIYSPREELENLYKSLILEAGYEYVETQTVKWKEHIELEAKVKDEFFKLDLF